MVRWRRAGGELAAKDTSHAPSAPSAPSATRPSGRAPASASARSLATARMVQRSPSSMSPETAGTPALGFPGSSNDFAHPNRVGEEDRKDDLASPVAGLHQSPREIPYPQDGRRKQQPRPSRRISANQRLQPPEDQESSETPKRYLSSGHGFLELLRFNAPIAPISKIPIQAYHA